MIHRRAFRSMGTDVCCLVECAAAAAASGALDAAEAEFHRLDALLSRFRPGSELSRLNRAGSLEAGPELYEVVQLALAARERTGGAFDPTVHDALVAAGYDRTFAEIDETAPAAPSAPCGGPVRLDPRTRRIELGEGARIDLGGIAKGWAADRVCTLLHRTGPALVDAGGDVAVAGLLDGRPWPVGGSRRRTARSRWPSRAVRSRRRAVTGPAGGAAARSDTT